MISDVASVVGDFAWGIEKADARSPVAVNQRSKEEFRAGMGPHTESAAVGLVMNELREAKPEDYRDFQSGVAYRNLPRQKCDLCIGTSPSWSWVIEVKLLRFLGDNGQPNDNILMHILSPYPAHRSALTDCNKLIASGMEGRKAIIIYGFESDDWPLEPAIKSFELLARSSVRLGPRAFATFANLVHPIHQSGAVFGWEISAP
jgi:hypothetical protein